MAFNAKILAAAFFGSPLGAAADHWPEKVLEAIDVKESAFCSVLDSYTKQMKEAVNSKNEIKVRNVYKKQIMDIKALMPTGAFSDWIVQVKSVKVDAALNATLRATLPCHKNIVGLEISPNNTVTYGQLSDVSLGDYALVSGQLSFEENLKDLTPEEFGADFSSIVGLN